MSLSLHSCRLVRGPCFQSSRIQEGLISEEESSRTSETPDTISRLGRVPCLISVLTALVGSMCTGFAR